MKIFPSLREQNPKSFSLHLYLGVAAEGLVGKCLCVLTGPPIRSFLIQLRGCPLIQSGTDVLGDGNLAVRTHLPLSSPPPSSLIRISILSTGLVRVGRGHHHHLSHQCPRDVKPTCGAWIAGGPWAGWSTGSTAEVTTGACLSSLQLLLSLIPPPLPAQLSACGLLTHPELARPFFSFTCSSDWGQGLTWELI